MHRRHVLKGLAATALCSLTGLSSGLAAAQQPSALPILMFHKVDDHPRYPEDISSHQLASLFDRIWRLGFRPVNISDILAGRVDELVSKGFKPLGITADDAHRSVLFSRTDAEHSEQRNARSFVDIFAASAKANGVVPRGTFFLSRVGDDRYSKEADSYFGKVRSLPEALERLASTPGIELGYHTRTHKRMKGMGANEVRELLLDQQRDFKKLGVLERISPLLAYPYGVLPTKEGIAELAAMGFLGAVEAYPGVEEAHMTRVPACPYDGKLLCDPFHLPRVCIGAFTYTPASKATAGAYTPIDPFEDFTKDVLNTPSPPYVSKGASFSN